MPQKNTKAARRKAAKAKPPAEEPQGLVVSTETMQPVPLPFEPRPFGVTGTKEPPSKIDVPADGTLIRKDGSPVVYVMSDGKRRPLGDANVFAACGFGWNEIVVLPPKEIDPIPVGEVVARQGDLQGRGA